MGQNPCFRKLSKPGGSLDGDELPLKGYVVRVEEKWRTISNVCGFISLHPSLEMDNASVLDEFYWLNKEDPNYSRCRVIEKRASVIY